MEARSYPHRTQETLRHLFQSGPVGNLTDGQLLERFNTAPAQVANLAFTTLVDRHGPMVLRVCNAILRDEHAAQDAFQTAFLVLARRARTLWVKESIAPWLHQVAVRSAQALRRRLRRQAARERAMPSNPLPLASARAAPAVPDLDLALLHEELARLPASLREPLILCDLEGRSQEQAARHLNCPIGTIKSRQHRARAKLRERLQRRGVEPALLAQPARWLAPGQGSPLLVPPQLAQSAVTRALAGRAGPTAQAKPSLIELTAQEVLMNLSLSTPACWLTGAAALAVSLGGIGIALLFPQDAEPSASSNAVPPAQAAEPIHGRSPSPRALATPVAPPTQEPARSPQKPPAQTQPDEVKLITASNQPLLIGIELDKSAPRARVEPAAPTEIFNTVPGSRRILKIAPDSQRVKKGDLIAQLDDSDLQLQLVTQTQELRAAEAAYNQAIVERETAQIRLKEYTSAVALLEKHRIQTDIKQAELRINNADARLARLNKAIAELEPLLANQALAPANLVARHDLEDRLAQATLDHKQASLDLENANLRKNMYEQFQQKAREIDLDGTFKIKAGHEVARKASFDQLIDRIKRLKEQIAQCTLRAPADGLLLYADDNLSQGPPLIEEGQAVQLNQRLFKLVDPRGPVIVRTWVKEALVDRIELGGKALITHRSESLGPEYTIEGRVLRVAGAPDRRGPNEDQDAPNRYEILIEPIPGQKPLRLFEAVGNVRAAVTLAEHSVVIPQYLIRPDPRNPAINVVFIRLPDGSFRKQPVKEGLFDWRSQLTEIVSGIQPGDQLVANPGAIWRDFKNQDPAPPNP